MLIEVTDVILECDLILLLVRRPNTFGHFVNIQHTLKGNMSKIRCPSFSVSGYFWSNVVCIKQLAKFCRFLALQQRKEFIFSCEFPLFVVDPSSTSLCTYLPLSIVFSLSGSGPTDTTQKQFALYEASYRPSVPCIFVKRTIRMAIQLSRTWPLPLSHY